MILNTYKCNKCKLKFEQYKSDTDIKCIGCESFDITKVFKPLNISKSDGMFSRKVPSGFKGILNEHAKRAGSLNRINTHGIGEV